MTSKPHIAHTLLSRAHSPDTASTLFTERIKQKPLYIRPTSPTPADNRSRRRLHRIRKKSYFLRKQKPQPLSAREKRATGLHSLPKEECKYAIFQELHGMWVRYMQEMLELGEKKFKPPMNPTAHGSKLVSADFHGAEVEVVRSRCEGRVGVRGIVVRDTKFTFVVVTREDEVKTIPKEQTIFRFCVPLPGSEMAMDVDVDGDGDGVQSTEDKGGVGAGKGKELVFELHGSQFQNRPVDRANKKFKWRNVDYI